MLKRVLCWLSVCAVLLCAPVSVAAEDTDATAVMDLNNVDMMDTFAVYHSVSSGMAMSVVYNRIAADVNHDTKMDMLDAFALYRVASGAANDLPRAAEVEVTANVYSETALKQNSVVMGRQTSVNYIAYNRLFINHSWNAAEVKLVCYDDDAVYVKLLVDGVQKAQRAEQITVTMDPDILKGRDVRLVIYTESFVPKTDIAIDVVEANDGGGPTDGKERHTATLIRSVEECAAFEGAGFETTFDEAFFKDSALLWVYAEEYNVPRELDVTGVQVRDGVLIAETTARYYSDVMKPMLYHKNVLMRVPAADVAEIEEIQVIRAEVMDIPFSIYS